ncbi:MAG: MFS transporter [Pirellulaceae bacterium]
MNLVLQRWLYAVCVLTDFAGFMVVFAVSRGLAEAKVAPWYLGLAGAGLSFSAGAGSILGGWLSHRLDGRFVFLTGAVALLVSILACGLGDSRRPEFLAGYWLLGIGLGFIYPPLIGWLNQGADPHANRSGVSRTLILFCIAWNLGMLSGQLSAGWLFSWGLPWTYGAALAAALVNLVLAGQAVRRVVPLLVEPSLLATPAREVQEIAALFKRLSWIANLGGMFGGSMVIHLLPDLAVAIGVPADDHGKLLAAWRAVIIATYLVMHWTACWQYRVSTSLGSQLLAAIGLVVIARANSAGMLLAGLALLGQLVGYNYFSGLFYSASGSSQRHRALAAGIHEATLAAGMALGTFVGGLLATWWDQRVPYLLAAGFMLTLTTVQLLAWRKWMPPVRSSPGDSTESG